MGAAGRRLVEQEFAWDHIAQRTADLYASLLTSDSTMPIRRSDH
jgi:glycosyltransferase involved in cell wall biosynthesis